MIQAIGLGLNLLGAAGQIAAANEERKAGIESGKRLNVFANKQRADVAKGYENLLNKGLALPEYQADMSLYEKAQQEAEMQKRMAGSSRVAGIGLAQEKVKQSTADMLAAGRQGATSGTDLLTLAALGQSQESSKMAELEGTSLAYSQSMQDRANQNFIQQLGQTAAAGARERGLMFESQLDKQKTLLGIEESRFKGLSDLDMNLFGMQQTAAANLAAARAAMLSGAGGVASAMGKGMLDLNSQDLDRKALLKIYGA